MINMGRYVFLSFSKLRLKKKFTRLLFAAFTLMPFLGLSQDHSIARIWNETTLEAIRHDLSRPTIHARNLFHTAVVMYDAWSVYDKLADPYLLGNSVGNYQSTFKGFTPKGNIEENRKAAISYAAYRLLAHRFKSTPDSIWTLNMIDQVFDSLGYDRTYIEKDYSNGDGRALGNYIAQEMIEYGHLDGANEETNYSNQVYQPKNKALSTNFAGNRIISDPNTWQPLRIRNARDKNGFDSDDITHFLSPEWGNVVPFSLKNESKSILDKDGEAYTVYHDPGPPPLLDSLDQQSTEDYKWGFMTVSIWASHLDPRDKTVWDTSPGAIGNLPVEDWPKSFSDMRNFYHFEGGDSSKGRSLNPVTGSAYAENKVLRADYTRVLAEFWADGPDSETPPGHWFTILNHVADHPDFEMKYRGQGEKLDRLEWDIKSYFVLGGAMHDAAIAAWSVKGYYDYIRPISAIRFMAEKGQSSDPSLPKYHKFGLPLIENYAATIREGDPLLNTNNILGHIKLFTWRGHEYVENPKTDIAQVGWIPAKNWWPYQRQDFVTPPFAGYVSGHSTFSRAAAEVMTTITGSEFFPGGMGVFNAKKNKYLKFENGPTEDIQLQWATYRDASDQTSLSRIWGGIHPPADDIPGRRIGLAIGETVVEFAEQYFNNEVIELVDLTDTDQFKVSPRKVKAGKEIKMKYKNRGSYVVEIKDLNNKVFYREKIQIKRKNKITLPENLHPGTYNIVIENGDVKHCHKIDIVAG